MYALSLKLYTDAQESMAALDSLEELALVYTLTPVNDSDGKPCQQCDFFFEHSPGPQVIDRIAVALQRPAKQLVPKSIAPQDWLALSYDRSAIYESRYFYFTAVENAFGLPVQTAKRPVVVNAAHAFGTGGHMSTKLAIDLIEGLYDQGVAPKHCVDFGCGSGILSLSCAALWPQTAVTSFDCMQESVAATKLAFDHNAYQPEQLTIMQAQDLLEALSAGAQSAPDLILANILPSVLKEKAGQIGAASPKGTYVILSGIIDEKAQDVLAHYEGCGFALETSQRQEGWTAQLMVKT